MKKSVNILLGAVLALGFASCSKEDPFPGDGEVSYGRFVKSALSVSLQNEAGVPDVYGRPTRAGAPDVNEFHVQFIKAGETTPTEEYIFAEMPEVVTLPIGDYTVKATFGQDLAAAWENPHYSGQSECTILEDEITENVEPIVCRLDNVRVSVDFDDSLLANMSADSKVTVYMGDGVNGRLDFTAADTEKSGYFAYMPESTTLAAEFNGTVEGYPTSETKAYDDVEPGRHYRITFKLHQAGEEDPGDVNTTLNVDATVEIVDMNMDVNPDDDVIDDDMRPKEEDPVKPDDPIDEKAAPAITAKAPINLETVNVYESGMECELYIHSEAGIDAFNVQIVSPNLTADELASVGLAQNLDLVNPDPSYVDGLIGLGFPVRVGGQKDVTFTITSFLPLLGVFGPNQHDFVLTVTDANGTTTKTLTLKFN